MLTDTEAKELLAKLSTHYGEPVLPLSKVCNAVYDWMRCIEDANKRAEAAGETSGAMRGDPRGLPWTQGNAYWKHLSQVRCDIMKSALMGRMLYYGEKVRTKMCPIHQGKQEMHIHLGVKPQCFHECDGSGWLREP